MLEHYEKAKLFLFILTDIVTKCIFYIVMKPVLTTEDEFLSWRDAFILFAGRDLPEVGGLFITCGTVSSS